MNLLLLIKNRGVKLRKQNIDLKGKTVLVTGAAGFIGSNLVKNLFMNNSEMTVVGMDNVNDYYDVSIKDYRLKEIEELAANDSKGNKWVFLKGKITRLSVWQGNQAMMSFWPRLRSAQDWRKSVNMYLLTSVQSVSCLKPMEPFMVPSTGVTNRLMD